MARIVSDSVTLTGRLPLVLPSLPLAVPPLRVLLPRLSSGHGADAGESILTTR